MKGKRIKNMDQLMAAAANRKSVIGFHWHRDIPMPAAFVQNMNAVIVHRVIQRGLFLYVPEPKKRYGKIV